MLCTETACNNKKKTIKKKPENPAEAGKSDFQSYYIMKWKCPLYNQKITRQRKKQEHMAYSQEKSKPTETTPVKDLIADKLDQSFKTIILKKLQERKM